MLASPRLLLLASVAFAAQTLSSLGATISVNWANDVNSIFRDAAGVALSQGAAGINQDGMLVQLGYFTGGTAASNFAGTWVPLTMGTRIGDSFDLTGEGAGRIAFDTFFQTGTDAVQVFDPDFSAPGASYTTTSLNPITLALPAANQVLGIRFFSGTSGTSGFYNTVSSDEWLWETPTAQGESISLSFASLGLLEFEDAANQFRTSLVAVPEPSTAVLLGTALGLCLVRARSRGARG